MQTNPIRNCLKALLDDLDQIGGVYDELYDSEVREQAGNALMESFVRDTDGYEIPASLGMLSDAANSKLHNSIRRFVGCAAPVCDARRVTQFHHRLSLLQDDTVLSAHGNDYDEFIGHTPPEWYDDDGNVLWDRVR